MAHVTSDPAILLFSGGIDSTVALAELRAARRPVLCLVVDYGQTLTIEVARATHLAALYDAQLLPLAVDFSLIGHHALLGRAGADLPRDRDRAAIAAAGTPPTYVPFRNGVFLSYAVALGEALGIRDIYCGGNGLDSGKYWDDTALFGEMFQRAAFVGTAPDYHPAIVFPNALRTKAEVAAAGAALKVPFWLTWSCYDPQGAAPGVMVHCGRCDSCAQRRAALDTIGLDLGGMTHG